MRQGEVMLLEIPSSPEYVAVARRAVESIARRMPFSSGEIEDITLAFGEACTNAVKYGCPTDDSPNVEIRCSVLPDGLCIEIRNNTADCSHPPVPTEPDLTREGGLGLYMIRKLVDEVDMSWMDHSAVVRLFKKMNGPD